MNVEVYEARWEGILGKEYIVYVAGLNERDCEKLVSKNNPNRNIFYTYMGSTNIIDVGGSGMEAIKDSLGIDIDYFTSTLEELWRQSPNRRF